MDDLLPLPAPDAAERVRAALRLVEPHDMPGAFERLLRSELGAIDSRVWLLDYGERALRSLPTARDALETAPIARVGDTSPLGRCVVGARPVVEVLDGARWRVLVPLTARSERIGVVDLTVAREPDALALAELARVADAIAGTLVLARRYTDLFARVRRLEPLALAAELQWELLQPGNYEGGHFRLAARLEPAYEIGGDHYDYAIEDGRLSLSVVDAMGHGLQAALLASLAAGALRNARRNGAALLDQVRAVNSALVAGFGGEHFVTGLILEIDLASGTGFAVNAGHPQAMRLRGDVVSDEALAPDVPLGLWPDATYRLQPISLEPGDRLVLVSDGVIEVASPRGVPFEREGLAELLVATAAEPPEAVVRALTATILAHRDRPLADDATVLCLDWSPVAGVASAGRGA